MNRKHAIVAALVLGSTLIVNSGAFAGRHDFVRGLRDSGQIVSLSEITKRARRSVGGGRVLEAELENSNGDYVYEVEVLDRRGVVHHLYYDARTGRRLRRW